MKRQENRESEFVLEAKDICYSYDSGGFSMNGVNLKIRRGTKSVLMGANGAGKSTLFYHFNGIIKPEKGTVLYNDIPISYRKKALIKMRSDVGVVFQNPDDQIFAPIVKDDVAFGPKNMGLSNDEVETRVEEALFQTGLTEFKEKGTMQLSYGQRKRVAFAGVMAMRPKILIMDEPTAGLDPQMAREVIEFAEQLHHRGVTIIMSIHDTDLSYAWADEMHVLRGGKHIYSGLPEGFYADPVQVHLSGLTTPSMLQMNDSIAAIHKKDPEPYPKTTTQLISKLSPKGKDTGTIYLHNVEDMTENDAPNVTDRNNSESKIGIYGILARRTAVKNKLHIDFYYDAIESCVMEAIHGRDSVLLCDKEVSELVISKVSAIKRFGTEVDVQRG